MDDSEVISHSEAEGWAIAIEHSEVEYADLGRTRRGTSREARVEGEFTRARELLSKGNLALDAIWVEVANLSARLACQEREMESQRVRAEAQEVRLREVEAALAVLGSTAERRAVVDAFSQWLADHPQEREKYLGKRVAIHPSKGIVASGTLRQVLEEVERQQLRDQVAIDYVR